MDVSEARSVDYESEFADVADMEDFYARIEDMGVVCGWRQSGDHARELEPSSPSIVSKFFRTQQQKISAE